MSTQFYVFIFILDLEKPIFRFDLENPRSSYLLPLSIKDTSRLHFSMAHLIHDLDIQTCLLCFTNNSDFYDLDSPVCQQWSYHSLVISYQNEQQQSTCTCMYFNPSTHWGRVHICVSKIIIFGSDDGLLPAGWRQAIIWTNAGILLIGPLGINFNEILI